MEILWLEAVHNLPAAVSGALAAGCGMLWPVFHSRTGMLTTQAAAGFFFAIHFFLIGATTGSFMNILTAAQAAAAVPLGERPGFRVVYLALLPAIAAGLVFTWGEGAHGWGPSVAAAAATALMSVARYQTDPLRLRWFMAAALPCWFVHNVWFLSWAGMASDVVGMTVNAAMLRRALSEKAAAAREGAV